MKIEIQPISKEKLMQDYPIDNLLPGWLFKCEEISNGHYSVKGSDLYGRLVSCDGENPNDLLKKAVQYARNLEEEKNRKN